MAKYIDGPIDVNGVNYYTMRIDVPKVSTHDLVKQPLDIIEQSKLYKLDGNFVVVDKHGQWLIWNIKAGISSDLNQELLAALIWADANCKAYTSDPSLHIGFWRRFSLHIFLSNDSTKGNGLGFCNQPGVMTFFAIVDRWFKFIDPQLYEEYCRLTVAEKRVIGESFLMAVLNKGGSKPHIDSQDRKDGCCCVVPVGEGWTGGELAFRDLHLKINAQPGDIIFFRSAQLYHENLPYSGDRRSIVLTTDANCFTTTGQFLNSQFIEQQREFNLDNNIVPPPPTPWTVPAISSELAPSEKRSYLKNRLTMRIQSKETAHAHKLINRRKNPDWQSRAFQTKNRLKGKKEKGTKRHSK